MRPNAAARLIACLATVLVAELRGLAVLTDVAFAQQPATQPSRPVAVRVADSTQVQVIRLRDGSSATVSGFSVNAIDTNGAGDTHIGAFVSALSRGEEPLAAVRYANAAAAISVTRPGGSSAPTHAEILAFIASREDAATSLMTA